ncbi:hypothetical protein AB1N83_012938, partial [Pleurotus pulmonarius]|jgi:hypothetical protein
LWK